MDHAFLEMCHACDSKVVSHFISQPGAEPPSISLCDDCVQTHTPAFVRDIVDDLKDASCQFCGNKAATTDSLPRIVDGVDVNPRYLCFSCSTESNKVAMEKFQMLESGSEALPYAEQTKLIRQVIEQIDAHMRRWVSQRDN